MMLLFDVTQRVFFFVLFFVSVYANICYVHKFMNDTVAYIVTGSTADTVGSGKSWLLQKQWCRLLGPQIVLFVMSILFTGRM